MKKSILSYVRELSIVIIGISAAFAINQCADDRKSHQREQKVLQNMIAELEDNNRYVGYALEASSAMIQQYDSAIKVLETNPNADIDLSVRFNKLVIANTSMELAISLGVLNEMDFQLARQISFCYHLQQDILEFERKLLTFIENSDETDPTYFSQALSRTNNYQRALSTLNETQQELLETLSNYLKD